MKDMFQQVRFLIPQDDRVLVTDLIQNRVHNVSLEKSIHHEEKKDGGEAF